MLSKFIKMFFIFNSAAAQNIFYVFFFFLVNESSTQAEMEFVSLHVVSKEFLPFDIDYTHFAITFLF